MRQILVGLLAAVAVAASMSFFGLLGGSTNASAHTAAARESREPDTPDDLLDRYQDSAGAQSRRPAIPAFCIGDICL